MLLVLFMNDWTYLKICDYSNRLTTALSEVLSVEKDDIFIGGEEKMFFYRLTGLCDVGERFCAESIYDVQHRLAEFQNLNCFARYRNRLRRSISGLFYQVRGRKKKETRRALGLLRDNRQVIHFAGHLRRDSFVLPNITKLFYSFPPKNRLIRSEFKKSLLVNGFNYDEAEFVGNIFPLSHLEAFSELCNHEIQAESELHTVCTSVYGIMIDPLLAALVRRNDAKKVYVQHGGYYGLVSNLAHQIEVEGSDEMLWWGVGKNNVFPTRYVMSEIIETSSSVRIICSIEGLCCDGRFIDDVTRIKDEKDWDLKIVGHPRSKNNDLKYDQYGISEKEHSSAGIVVYDNALHSLLYSRLINKSPFFVIDGYYYQCQHDSADKFLELMRVTGVMSDFATIMRRVEDMMSMTAHQRREYFCNKTAQLIEYVYSFPRLNDIYNVCD